MVRNVTGCPLAGLDGHEVLDASPLAVEVAHLLTANPEFYNLPRKFKISVTGCPIWCSYPEINDVGLTGLKRVKDGEEEVGYSLRVGGGLSAEPHLAVRLNAFVPQDKALAAVKAVCEIFREQEVLRESRTHARLKYLFMRHGWTAETMLAAIEEKIGFTIRSLRRGPDCGGCVSRSRGRARAAAGGVELCRRDGAEWAIESGTAACACGAERRVWRWASARDDWAEYCAREYSECEDAGGCREDCALGLEVQPNVFYRGAVACTGTEFCKLAIAETKGFAKWLVGEMEERLPEFDQQLRLHVTGCTNSCGQSWIADIGLEGKKLKKDGKMVDAFYFCVGGAVGEYAGIARQIGYRAAAEDCPEAIERLLRGYLKGRGGGENLRAYFRRTSDEDLRTLLAGGVVEAVERDPAPGRVPANVG